MYDHDKIYDEEGIDFKAMRDKCTVTLSDEIPDEQLAIGIIEDEDILNLGTLGNFSIIKGQAKSKKTFLTSMIFACSVGGKCLNKFFTPVLQTRKNVFFDTEQSKGRVKKIAQRVNTLADSVANLEFISLRAYSPKERLDFIEQYIETEKNLGLLIIDGARDLLVDINSLEESNDVVTKFMKWTENHNLHICTVIHENYGSVKARGHIGTELANKAETVISVMADSEDRDMSYVSAVHTRDRSFKEFSFSIDGYGLPSINLDSV